VLLVDDDANCRILMTKLWSKAGILNPLVVVGSGDEAKTYLRQCCLANGAPRGAKPCIVIVDLAMPVVSGWEVLHWMRTRNAFRLTKIVVMSHLAAQERDTRIAEEVRADAYLDKFPTATELILQIGPWLGGIQPMGR
jgi:two-component system, response regulator